MIRQIILADQPVIRRKLKPIKSFDQELFGLVRDLIDTMNFTNGAGLAANQIGVDAEVFVTGIGSRPQVFINPKVKILGSVKESLEEGCLSIPGYRGDIARSKEVEITYDDLKGKRKKLRAKGYLARVIQHESDHLQGKVYLDRLEDKSRLQKVVPVRIAFFGSGSFAVPSLYNLVGLNWTFDFLTVGVVTQPARPAGRKKTLNPTPISITAERFGVPTLTPEKFDEKFYREFAKWKVDLIVLADYGKIIPVRLLKLPKHGALNVHPSLLPKYRGSTPIQQAILQGDEKTGVTVIKMNESVDAGAVVGQYELAITEGDNYLTLLDKLSQLGAILLRDLLPYYTSGEIKPKPQPKKGVSLAPRISKEEGLIKPGDSADLALRKVRALVPWPGAYVIYQDKKVKILSGHLEDGRLAADLVQPEGGRPMTYRDFKNGYGELAL